MRRILITGANGHIGANTVREALDQGYEVVAMVRETSDMRSLEGLKITKVIGDIRDKAAVREAAEGCEAVIHLATPYETWTPDGGSFITESAMQGTQNIFEVSHEVGIARMVYTSSSISIGLSKDPAHARNAKNWNEGGGHTIYAKAKNASEHLAWQLAEQYDIPTISLCPDIVIGAYDYRITPSTTMFLDMIEGKLPAYPGSVDIVDVRDVAYVHVAALTKGTPGQRYIVGAETRTIREWGQVIAQLTGVKPIYLTGPRFVSLALGSIDEFFSRRMNRRPVFIRDLNADFYKRYQSFDYTQTFEAFDYTPRDGITAMQAMLDWLLSIDAFTPRTTEKIKKHQAQIAVAS